MEETLKYPIGEFDRNFELTPELKAQFVSAVSELPQKINSAVENLTEEQFDAPYRPGGWTVRQTVHHIADSHQNALIRFKLALTEDVPTIRPYYEDRWAELADSGLPIESSLKIIEGLHLRWTTLLGAMQDSDFQKKLIHPDSGEWTLGEFLGLYAWHGLHHTAHITRLLEKNDW